MAPLEGDESPRSLESGVDLHWIPLGAGGVGYVRFNGRVYEWTTAKREHRPARSLYHTALEVHVPSGRYVIENAWPSPDGHTASRGVVFEGPVFDRRLTRFRPFRYEVRCWLDGSISDLRYAARTDRVTVDPDSAGRLLELVPSLPRAVWGRDEAGIGEMWNSNSVISFLLTAGGFDASSMSAPEGGAAPGWRCGVALATSPVAAPDAPGASE